MTDELLRESIFLQCFGRLWERFMGAARESVTFSALSGSRFITVLLRNLPISCGILIGLLFIVPHGLFNNLFSLAMLLFVTGLVLLAVLQGKCKGLSMHRMGGYAVVYWTFIAIQGFASQSFSLSLRFLLFHLTAFLGLVVTSTVLTDRRALKHFVAVLLAMVAIGGLYGCLQSVTGVKVVSSQVDLSLNINMPGRIYSFFENPNNFAEILVLTLPLFAAMFFMAETGIGKRAAFLAALPPALSLLLTFSRSGWMAFGLSVFVFFYFTYRWMVPVLFGIALAALPFLPASIRERFFSTFAGTDSSILYRSAIRDTLRPVLSGHWVEGMGLGVDTVRDEIARFYEQNEQYNILTWQIAPHAHNLYLQLWAELGIVGAASFCGMILSFLRRGVVALYTAPKKNFFAAAGIAGIVGALVVGFVEYIWFYPRAMLLFWLVMGITWAALRIEKTETNDQADA